ncbi:MAG: thioredoxin family protein [Dysgonamonadaceae bacterium]|jgi:thiol-disulfide isomerase/thioredoxin|nr:thioredoxin family protein [Dysgonamonadaceae bacterium]
MRLQFVSLFVTGCFFSLFAQEPREGIVFHENEPWETILQQAKAANKPIFMDCYTEWCGPCKGLVKNVFPLKKVGDFFNAHFINTSYDMEKGDGAMLHEKYKEHIIGFPTLLMISPEGEVMHRMAGYKEPDDLIAGFKEALEGQTFYAAEKKYNEGARDTETMTAYTEALRQAYLTLKLDSVGRDYLQHIPVENLMKPEVWNIAGKFVKDPYSAPYKYVVSNIDRLSYRAKANRYDLEQQLSRGMSSAINEIVKVSRTTVDPDSILWAKTQSQILLDIIGQHNIKNFLDFTAKLKLNELRLENKPLEIFETLRYIRPMGMLNTDKLFTAEMYDHVIMHVKDKKIIQQSLDEVLALQSSYKSSPALSGNFYNTIAAAYTKLNQKDKAAEALTEYEKREKIKTDFVKDLLEKNDDNNKDLVN